MTTSGPLTLWLHDESLSPQEAVFNPNLVPFAGPGTVLKISPVKPVKHESNEKTKEGRRYIFVVSSLDNDLLKKNANLQVSLRNDVAKTFRLTRGSSVQLSIVERSTVEALYVEFSLRDLSLDRADMWRLSSSLLSRTLYLGQRVNFISSAIRVIVKSIYVRQDSLASRRSRLDQDEASEISSVTAFCGLVTERTRPVFRTESSRFVLLVQMSAEQWEFDEDGEILYNKCVDGYLPELFGRWRDISATHLVTIILFARVLKDGGEKEDFFKTVVDNVRSSDWAETLLELKREFLKFQKEVLVRVEVTDSNRSGFGIVSPSIDESSAKLEPSDEIERAIITGRISPSSTGNILEAISLAAHQFSYLHIDPDVLRTGISIIVISPGTGIHTVEKHMLERTTENLMRGGVSIDLVCLARKPLHTVPLFRYRDIDEESAIPDDIEPRPSSRTTSSTLNSESHGPWTYALPHWLEVSYWNRPVTRTILSQSLLRNKNVFEPRCRMHELQMMGIMENEMSSIAIPILYEVNAEEYDEKVFKRINETQKREGEANKADANFLHSFGRRLESFGSDRSNDDNVSSSDVVELSRSWGKSETDTTTYQNKAPLDVKPREKGGGLPLSQSITITAREGAGRGKGSVLQTGFELEKRDTTQVNSSATNYTNRGGSSSQALPVTSERSSRRQSAMTMPKSTTAEPTSPLPWQVIPNPSNPSSTDPQTHLAHYRRWQYVNPSKKDPYHSIAHVKWNSMCAPASLPLQSTWFPSYSELQNDYQVWTYTITVDPDVTDLNQGDVMKEMIGQRLSQGYQLVVESEDFREEQDDTFGMETMIPEERGIPVRRKGEQLVPRYPDDRSFGRLMNRPMRLSQSKGIRHLPGPLAELSSTVYLSSGEKQIHKIQRDLDGHNVTITQYVKKMGGIRSKPLQYVCQMWGNYQDGYTTITTQLQSSATVDNINWNYVDQLISGYEDRFTDFVKYKRGRWVLIPCEVPQPLQGRNDEETRLEGVMKLNEIFQRAVWRPPEEKKNRIKIKDVNIPDIVFCTDNVSKYIEREAESLAGYDRIEQMTEKSRILQLGTERFNKTTDLKTLAVEMQAPPPKGVIRFDRAWHFRKYEDAFVGSELVTWLVANLSDIRSREDAVTFGEGLKKEGLFVHCAGRHDFLDGNYFYRFAPEYALPSTEKKEPRRGWLATLRNVSVSSPTMPTAVPGTNTSPISATTNWARPNRDRSGSVASFYSNQSPVQRPSVTLSSVIKYDVDRDSHSYRPEYILLHYDRIHNADSCYHIRLEWIACTTRLIQAHLRSWSQAIQKYGLRLVEAPVDEISEVTKLNPFREPLEITLSVKPPFLQDQPDYYQVELLKRFNFILDTEAGSCFPSGVNVIQSWGGRPSYRQTQYIHQSGLAFAQVSKSGSILWLTNRMFVSRIETAIYAPPFTLNPDALRGRFKTFCLDKSKLEAFFADLSVQVARRGSVAGLSLASIESDGTLKGSE